MKTSSAGQKENVVSVRGVVNRFGKNTVHDGLDFDIERGDIMGIVGGSGSGKSVLLRSILGLRAPNKGTIQLMGEDIRKLRQSDKAGMFGVLFQQGALFSALTVEQNIMVPLKEHTKLPQNYQAVLARLKVALSGLPVEAGQKYPSELSGGMIKRAALARAMALDPPILFLDEPTAGLDPISAADFDQLILNLNKGLGLTVALITHDLDTLFTICNKVAVLVDKKIIVDTIPNLLKNNNPWIKSYFHGKRSRAAMAAGENSPGENSLGENSLGENSLEENNRGEKKE